MEDKDISLEVDVHTGLEVIGCENRVTRLLTPLPRCLFSCRPLSFGSRLCSFPLLPMAEPSFGFLQFRAASSCFATV